MNRLFHAVSVSLVCTLLLAGCETGSSPVEPEGVVQPDPAELARLHAPVMTFCGGCHDPPSPDSFPRDAWQAEIELAYRLFAESSRRDLTPPPMSDVVTWYRSQAPAILELRPIRESPSPVRFRFQEAVPGGSFPSTQNLSIPGVSHVLSSTRTEDGTAPQLFFCDMSRNGVFTVNESNASLSISNFVNARNPAHIEETDLNGDRSPDYLLCELGSFLPEDHDRGRLIWLNRSQDGTLTTHVLLDSVGRIADARPGDFDLDGDLDVIVAVFGWRKTGQLLILEQIDDSQGTPEFRARQLDDRHGAIHLPVVDLDADGDLDFVALFSQEHETIEAFLNRGDATFERQIVYLTGSPSYGSSGIEVTDLDQDGDPDILYTNGDTLDSSLLKPYHSIQWLENTGDFPFTRHLIGSMPGAFRAVPSDIDSDGDIDVVASAWIPDKAEPPSPRSDRTYITLAWYEQVAPSSFECHPLRSGKRDGYLTLAVSDVNVDGTPDIVAGRFSSASNGDSGWIDFVWNEGSD